MSKIVISGSGVYTPPDSISNEELSASYNSYAAKYNEGREKEIAAGETAPLKESGAQFIFNASGIRSRYVVDKTGILDPERMRPRLREYSDEGVSIQAGMGERAARQALEAAETAPGDIDALIVACTAVERLYPPVSVEIQKLLGARGFAFDLQAACSSMAFRHSDGKGHDQRRERQEGASHKPGDMHGARLFQGQRDPLPLRGRRGGVEKPVAGGTEGIQPQGGAHERPQPLRAEADEGAQDGGTKGEGPLGGIRSLQGTCFGIGQRPRKPKASSINPLFGGPVRVSEWKTGQHERSSSRGNPWMGGASDRAPGPTARAAGSTPRSWA